MPELGTISIYAALGSLIVSACLYVWAGSERGPLMRWARGFFCLTAGCVVAAAAILGALLVTHRFDVAYVYEHSARAMAPLYWFPSFWSGQEGSFLLWAFWISLLGLVLAATSHQAESRVMPVYSTVLGFLLIMLMVRSPFVPLDTQGMPVPTEGLGLNPNLENPWMVIHPPTLFLGFSALTVPWAYAMAALWKKDWDGWLRWAWPWALFGFSVLGTAMMMGGYWAYEMLGWGGFWEWDPVENGPFIPWMLLGGFLHLAQVQRVRGSITRSALLFGALPFAGVMYESFLTRSGVLADFSVHSFSELGGTANKLLLGALIVVVALPVLGLVARNMELAARDRSPESPLDVITSREFGLIASLGLLTLCAVVAAVGMSAPLLTGIATKWHLVKYTASVSEDYHNRAMFPMAILAAVGLGLGPYLRWRSEGKPDVASLIRSYVIAVVAAVGLLAATSVFGTMLTGKQLMPELLLFTAAVFALVSNGALLLRMAPFREQRIWTVGGVVSHIGAATLLLGLVFLVVFVRKDPDVELMQGRPQQVLNGAYTLTYRGQSSDYKTDKNNDLLFDVVSRDGREKLLARLPFARRPLEDGTLKIFGHPAIVHHVGGDLYLALADGPDELYPRGRYVKKIPLGGTLDFNGYTIRFDTFQRDPQAAAMAMAGQMPAAMPVWAVLYVTYHGKTSVIKPEFVIRRDLPGEPDTPEAVLPGGWNIAFTAMNAGSSDRNDIDAGASAEAGTFVIRPDGPVVEGFELEVTTRPMIWLVWLGTALVALGSLISMVRRVRENRAIPISGVISSPREAGNARRTRKKHSSQSQPHREREKVLTPAISRREKN